MHSSAGKKICMMTLRNWAGKQDCGKTRCKVVYTFRDVAKWIAARVFSPYNLPFSDLYSRNVLLKPTNQPAKAPFNGYAKSVDLRQ